MKKRMIAVILVFVMVLSMAGCAKKTSLAITIDGIGDYRVVQVSRGLKNFSVVENEIHLTVKNNGVYDVVVQDDNGQEYTFTLTYQDGDAEVISKDKIALLVRTE